MNRHLRFLPIASLLLVALAGCTSGTDEESSPPAAAPSGTVEFCYPSSGPVEWILRFGGSTMDASPERVLSIAVLGDDDIVFTARTYATVNLGGGKLDALADGTGLLVRLKRDGMHRWSRSFKAGQLDQVHIDATGTLVGIGAGSAAEFGGEIQGLTDSGRVVAWFGGDGALLQGIAAPVISSLDESFISMTPDGNGGIWATGRMNRPTTIGSFELMPNSMDTFDVLVVHYDKNGVPLFAGKFGGMADDVPSKIALDEAGNVYVTGTVGSEVDFGGGALGHAGDRDVFILSLDAQGMHRWSKIQGSAGSDEGHSIAASGSAVFFGGTFRSSVDFGAGPVMAVGASDAFLLHEDPAGNTKWVKTFGSMAAEGISHLAATPERIAFLGEYQEPIDVGGGLLATSEGTYSTFVASYDKVGDHLNSVGLTRVRGISMAIAPDQSIYVGGTSYETLELPDCSITSAPGGDAVIMKLRP